MCTVVFEPTQAVAVVVTAARCARHCHPVAATGRPEPCHKVRELGGRPARPLAGTAEQLPLGQGDDLEAVNARDLLVQQYDALYLEGGWTRRRLELKVARDPWPPGTTRQLLMVAGVITALVAWRVAVRKA